MANSLLFDLSDSYMPFYLSSEGLNAQIEELFHEFVLYYGEDVNMTIGVKLAEEHSTDSIKFDTEKGVMLGQVPE